MVPVIEAAVPLCHGEHTKQHGMPEQQFWDEVGIDPLPWGEYLMEITGQVTRASNAIYTRQMR